MSGNTSIMGGGGRWGVLLYYCVDCFETKLLMYHKVRFSLFRGDGGWWGGLSKKYILS